VDAAGPAAGNQCSDFTQPLVELYRGCMVALKVSLCGIITTRTCQCSDFTPIFIGMHRNAPLSPMKRVPGCTIPMVPMHLPPVAPMNLVEQIRALRGQAGHPDTA
jgi:hypothetical protein